MHDGWIIFTSGGVPFVFCWPIYYYSLYMAGATIGTVTVNNVFPATCQAVFQHLA
jgi:hypothetical protein